MSIFELSLGFILIHLLRRWADKQEQGKYFYFISGLSKEEYQQMKKKVEEMLAERKNM